MTLAAVMLTGCYTVNIYNTDHPATGKLSLTTDWTNRTEGVAVPASYTAECVDPGGKVTLTGTVVEYPNLFVPGTYTLHLYNTAEKITLSGTTATVASAGTAGIDPLPGFQFWGAITQTIEADKDYSATVTMRQITRQLSFDLTIAEGDPERITALTATLDGVAGAWDMATDAPGGAVATVTPAFTRTGDKLTATVRLLGIAGAKQTLTLNLTFADGRTQQIVSDITSPLTAFNSDKKAPLTLSGHVNTPIASSHGGTITGWKVVLGGGVIDIY